MSKLLCRSATVTLQDYGVVTAAPAAGASTSGVQLFARSVRENVTADEIDQTAIGDTVKQTVPGQNDTTIEIECYVQSTGFVLKGLMNHWVRVTIDPDDAGGVASFNVDGAMIGYGYDLAVGESQIERATIKAAATAFA